MPPDGSEVAWAGSGGGQSELIAKPACQIGVGPYPDDQVRDVPDEETANRVMEKVREYRPTGN